MCVKVVVCAVAVATIVASKAIDKVIFFIVAIDLIVLHFYFVCTKNRR